jgi:hypothetical protein
MITPLYRLPKVRSSLIMASASGQPCSLRIASFVPGRQCNGHDTTVGAHLPVFGKGTSTKVTDLAVVYACYSCHAILDGADASGHKYVMEHFPAAVIDRMLNGLVETQARMVEDGIILVPKAELV